MAKSHYELRVMEPAIEALSDSCITVADTSSIGFPRCEQRSLRIDRPSWQTQSCSILEEVEEGRELQGKKGSNRFFWKSGTNSDPRKLQQAAGQETGSLPALSPKGGKSWGTSPGKFKHRTNMAESTMTKLPNSLIEMCVLVGLDQDTGVRCARHAQISQVTSVCSLPLDPQILAVITNQSAHFPSSKIPSDPDYPLAAEDYKSPLQSRGLRKTSLLKRGVSRRMSVKPRPMVPHNQEMIASLPTLCFPSDAFLSQTQQRETFKYLVLTSISGSRSYATCLTFSRQYQVVMSDNGTFELHPEATLLPPGPNKTVVKCWVPFCICVVSSQPYFLVVKQCLSTLIPSLNKGSITDCLKNFTIQMVMVPTPPAGSLCVSFCLKDSPRPIIVHPPDNPAKPVIDIPLNLPFLCFSIENVLEIITCLLTQQRLVFVSHDFALLTPIVECFLFFILPFKWPFVYVPVVSTSLLDLLEAPGCFIMGCNAVHRSRISQIEGLVIVDIDQGRVEPCKTIQMPSIPEEAIRLFLKYYHRAKSMQHELVSLSRETASTLENDFSRREKLRWQYQKDIQESFTEMYTFLLRDFYEFMNFDQRRFKAEDFVNSQLEEDREFYSVFVNTQLFKGYKNDRFEKKKDHYLNFSKRTRHHSFKNEPHTRRKFVSSAVGQSSARKADSLKGAITSHSFFTLPSFVLPLTSTQQFYDNCIEQISRSIKTVKSASVKASYLYLRGMFHIACARPLDGLDDFHNLHTTDLSIFPMEEITRVVEDLSPSEKVELEEQDFYKRGEILKKISQRKRPLASNMSTPTIPEDLPQDGVLTSAEFINFVQFLEIAIDMDVIERLFNALTGGSLGVLDGESFFSFVEAWKDGEIECNAIPDVIFQKALDHTETILKISSLISTDQGMGRLVLTDKRLFILTEGNNTFHEVIRIRDIACLEKFDQSYLLLSSAPALRIYSRRKDKEPYMANLKGERNSWYTLINEMWAGRTIAEAQKDPHIVQQAARNVFLLDAAIRSAENGRATYAKHLEVVSKTLCHFTRLKEDMGNTVPETSNALVHKFNPSNNEAHRSTVEAMIYTPGYHSDEDGTCPKLWCAMGSGKVKVFDGSNFMLEAEIPEAKDRVCCLVCVGGEHVWAGSFDTTIYIIDVHTYAANKQLMDHNDIVSDIAVVESQRTAYTASLNGQIMEWDTATLSKTNAIQLQNTDKLISIKCDKKSNHLWCCTKDDIRLVNNQGAVLQRFIHPDEQGSPILLETFIIGENTLWAGCGRRGELVTWDTTSFKKLDVLKISCRGVSKLVAVNNRIWVASKQGKIHLFDLKRRKYEKTMDAHEDAIRSMTQAESRYVYTGAGSKDGKVAVWRTEFLL